jgi:hypothetical protein
MDVLRLRFVIASVMHDAPLFPGKPHYQYQRNPQRHSSDKERQCLHPEGVGALVGDDVAVAATTPPDVPSLFLLFLGLSTPRRGHSSAAIRSENANATL